MVVLFPSVDSIESEPPESSIRSFMLVSPNPLRARSGELILPRLKPWPLSRITSSIRSPIFPKNSRARSVLVYSAILFIASCVTLKTAVLKESGTHRLPKHSVLSVRPPHYLGRAEEVDNLVLKKPMPLLEVHHMARIRNDNILLGRIR